MAASREPPDQPTAGDGGDPWVWSNGARACMAGEAVSWPCRVGWATLRLAAQGDLRSVSPVSPDGQSSPGKVPSAFGKDPVLRELSRRWEDGGGWETEKL